MVRHYLYEAANCLLTTVTGASALKSWGLKMVKRCGAKRARTAVAHHIPRRRPLRPTRGDGMVRGQPRRLRLRPARFEAAGEENRRGGGRGAHRARFVEQTGRARLCRNTPQGQILEPRAARRRPHRSHPARARDPLRRHQRRIRRGEIGLQTPSIARAGRPRTHQAAQDAARF